MAPEDQSGGKLLRQGFEALCSARLERKAMWTPGTSGVTTDLWPILHTQYLKLWKRTSHLSPVSWSP